jgi:WD40 repeat protein
MPEKATARAVAISHDDRTIVVGMKDGTVWVITCNPSSEKGDLDWKFKKSFKQASEWISDIKFSPDDSKCAIGSHDNFVYIYETSGSRPWKKSNKKLKGHSSYITHIDWSLTGEYL